MSQRRKPEEKVREEKRNKKMKEEKIRESKKNRLAKAAGAQPSGQRSDEKLHAVVAPSTCPSQMYKSHQVRSGAFMEVEMSKKCTLFWREVYFQVGGMEGRKDGGTDGQTERKPESKKARKQEREKERKKERRKGKEGKKEIKKEIKK